MRMGFKAFSELPMLDEIILQEAGGDLTVLREGKWVKGRFDKSIRIDQPTHLGGAGEPHAHVYGRKGNEIVVVNKDGTASHGTKGRISDEDASVLRSLGWNLPAGNIVEWTVVGDVSGLLLG